MGKVKELSVSDALSANMCDDRIILIKFISKYFPERKREERVAMHGASMRCYAMNGKKSFHSLRSKYSKMNELRRKHGAKKSFYGGTEKKLFHFIL